MFKAKSNCIKDGSPIEPIVERHIFEQVQKGRGMKRNPGCNPAHPLVGKLICGCCKKNLSYRKGKNPYFTCQNRYTNGMDGCVVKINAKFLEKYVLYMLKDRLYADKEDKEAVSELDRKMRGLKEKKRLLTGRIQKLQQQKFEAYQNYIFGKADSFYSDDMAVKSLEKELDDLNDTVQKMECGLDGCSIGNGFTVLSKEMTDCYIEKIVVYDEQNIFCIFS